MQEVISILSGVFLPLLSYDLHLQSPIRDIKTCNEVWSPARSGSVERGTYVIWISLRIRWDAMGRRTPSVGHNVCRELSPVETGLTGLSSIPSSEAMPQLLGRRKICRFLTRAASLPFTLHVPWTRRATRTIRVIRNPEETRKDAWTTDSHSL